MSPFKIELLNNSKQPVNDNGIYKCYAYEDGEILPNTGSLINLGFKLQVPKEYFIHVFSTTIKSLGGVGDSDYRGIYNLIVYNNTEYSIKYKKDEYVGNFCLIKGMRSFTKTETSRKLILRLVKKSEKDICNKELSSKKDIVKKYISNKDIIKKKDISKNKKVSFTEDTVDNEFMNKKKSKICCIFHSNNECKDNNKYER